MLTEIMPTHNVFQQIIKFNYNNIYIHILQYFLFVEALVLFLLGTFFFLMALELFECKKVRLIARRRVIKSRTWRQKKEGHDKNTVNLIKPEPVYNRILS